MPELAHPDKEAITAQRRSGIPDQALLRRLSLGVLRGRGAVTNPPVRFESAVLSPFDDGWDTLAGDVEEAARAATKLIKDSSRSVIAFNQSPDLGFDRAVNPYRGCEHGCVYCHARPSHADLGYSPGLDFETKLVFKPEVATLLEKELRKPGYVPKVMVLGSNTDPYQPVERTLKLTRAVLEVLDRFNHPVAIVTKSAGVLRDLDILSSMAKRDLARVYLSVTTLKPSLARVMEPRAATPARRLHAIEELTRAGVSTGILTAPMIPGLNDAEMEKLLEAGARAGARHAGFILLRLPHELRGIFEAWLNEHYPARAQHVLGLIRDTRGGELNDSRFGQRFIGKGPYAEMLMRRFTRAARQWGLDEAREGLDCSRFALPEEAVREPEPQLSLF